MFFLAMKAYNNMSTEKVDKEWIKFGDIVFDGTRESGFLGKRVANEMTFGIQLDKALEEMLGVSFLNGKLEDSWSK